MSGQDSISNVRYIIFMHSVRFKARRQKEQDRLVLILLMVLLLLNCISLYKGAYSAKTAAVANARQVKKLYRHDQATAFELQRP